MMMSPLKNEMIQCHFDIHLRSTEHHSYARSNNTDDKEEPENFDDIDTLPDVVDGPCLIGSMNKFMEKTFDIEYRTSNEQTMDF